MTTPTPIIDALEPCGICHGCGWICEDHGAHPSDTVSKHPTACGSGPGILCACNQDMHLTGFEGGVIICSTAQSYDGRH